MPILCVQQISKRFNGFSALHEVSLDVERGETIAIIGASGSGKSTLLRCVGNLERIDSGSICIDGDYLAKDEGGAARYPNERTCRQIARKTGMVFQQFHLFPHLTCLENITIAPIRVLGQDRLSAEKRAKELLALVGLSHRADSFPAQLSGGQQQRVAIARALALDPEIMLFDEPTSALDPELTGEVMAVITRLAQRDMTMLIVTHEMEFARRTADRVLFFEGGRIAGQDTPERFFGAQQNERIRRFLAGGAL